MDAATQADMEARISSRSLLEIADKDSNGSVDAAFLAAHLSQANSLAISIAGELSETPSYVIGYQCDIAAYTMAKESRMALAEEHRTAYDNAIKSLHRLRTPEEVGTDRVFTLSKLDGLL